MFDHEKKGFFEAFTPKTAFIMGLIASFLLICTLGFFIMLAKAIDNKDNTASANNNKVAANNVANNDVVQPDAQAEPAAKVNVKLTGSYHILGDKNAPVKMVVFSDMQCPYCKNFHPTIKQAIQEYGKKVAFIFKHFPLEQIHPNARPAAEASECIYEQKGDDGFFKFLDQAFANQTSLSGSFYEQVAKDLGLNMDKFKTCVSTNKYKSKVDADVKEGLSYDVQGTPASFINGTRVPGAVPYASFKGYIDAALK